MKDFQSPCGTKIWPQLVARFPGGWPPPGGFPTKTPREGDLGNSWWPRASRPESTERFLGLVPTPMRSGKPGWPAPPTGESWRTGSGRLGGGAPPDWDRPRSGWCGSGDPDRSRSPLGNRPYGFGIFPRGQKQPAVALTAGLNVGRCVGAGAHHVPVGFPAVDVPARAIRLAEPLRLGGQPCDDGINK